MYNFSITKNNPKNGFLFEKKIGKEKREKKKKTLTKNH